MVCPDFGQLRLNSWIVNRKPAELAERLGSLFHIVLLDQVSRGLGEEEHATEENKRPGKLNGDWDAVRTAIIALSGRVVDNGGEEETDRDGPLVRPDDESADPFRCCLRLVKRDYYTA